MKNGPDIARVAALIGDPARANMLTALLGGSALTASELALEAGITRQTASSHLAKLSEADLIATEAQGRHRYFRLADREVGRALESLMSVAARPKLARKRPGPKEPAMRRARACYDHLAGELGVALYDGLIANAWIAEGGHGVSATRKGVKAFGALGIDVPSLAASKRPLCRTCLDWSERRHHLAGGLGAAILTCVYEAGWARRDRTTRAVHFSPAGEAGFRRAFSLGA
jgi:DNA-binding transcriptional ArsR family regulator